MSTLEYCLKSVAANTYWYKKHGKSPKKHSQHTLAILSWCVCLCSYGNEIHVCPNTLHNLNVQGLELEWSKNFWEKWRCGSGWMCDQLGGWGGGKHALGDPSFGPCRPLLCPIYSSHWPSIELVMGDGEWKFDAERRLDSELWQARNSSKSNSIVICHMSMQHHIISYCPSFTSTCSRLTPHHEGPPLSYWPF